MEIIRVLALDFDAELESCIMKLGNIECVTSPHGGKYDIVAIGENGCIPAACDITASTVLCPQDAALRESISCGQVISCGMGCAATFSFSSIGEDSAVFSVNKSVRSGNGITENCEYRVPFRRDISVYDNLIINGIGAIM